MNANKHTRRRNKVDKKCPVCKKVYTTFDAKKKYCSDACAKQANKRK